VRIEQQAAFILHQRNYSETSLLVEFLTPDHGRLTALAKGARRPSSPFRGALKPFQPLLVGWVGRTDLPILTHAEADGGVSIPGGSAIYCGFYLNELLCRLLHRHDPHPNLYARYASTLNAIADAPLREQPLRFFELHLLRELGYGPVLDHDIITGQPICADSLYDYVPDRGPFQVATRGDRIAYKGLPMHGETLLGLAQEQLDSALRLREAKRLMRLLLSTHLGMEPLHSRLLMQRVLAARDRAQMNNNNVAAFPSEAVCGEVASDD